MRISDEDRYNLVGNLYLGLFSGIIFIASIVIYYGWYA